jgi:POT family proton-dependent oligopeptide transporter
MPPIRTLPADPELTPQLRAVRYRTFFGHPRGLATLFMTEMWERFSFYGMRALLVLYLVAPVSRGGLGFEAGTATAVYSVYNAMVYLLTLPGGWVSR